MEGLCKQNAKWVVNPGTVEAGEGGSQQVEEQVGSQAKAGPAHAL